MSSAFNQKMKSEDEKEKRKKEKNKQELFIPLKKRSEIPNIEIQIENSCLFPKVGVIGNNEQIKFIGHSKPIIKIIFIQIF